ncbi:hypothetical protein HYALB_00013571 [Hymenoscyphus albidus]|uniref:Elongator complex protein 4 n=1 Tax=Hymenoscyphus albidus TaxID=595503 RepID=A0A9N9LVF7_9HELO|nr:hypothetical protein HYALB_00013571 [Hymenoscyphus albidus]
MSFRKRGIVVPQAGPGPGSPNPLGRPNPIPGSTAAAAIPKHPPGTRPSPLDGRLTTSTGTRSLDALLAGHAGLALGTSLLIEESGTTDFAGSLLKYYVAEGVVQKHTIHVLGMPEGWGRELPGLGSGDDGSKGKKVKVGEEKMNIAWRYERLGEFGATIGGGARERNFPQSTPTSSSEPAIFCHDFDLSKRLILPSPSNIHFIPLSAQPTLTFIDSSPSLSPFTKFIHHLTTNLQNSPPTTIHRLAIPNLFSPALYPSHTSNPTHILPFLHTLRALLRKYPTRLALLITLPLPLSPRSTGLTRWIELLSDGVLELSPFPSSAIVAKPAAASTVSEEPPQGMVNIHRLPVVHEKGGGGGGGSGMGDDLSFSLSRRRGMVIRPYSLPPVKGDGEAKEEEGRGLEVGGRRVRKGDIEF